MHSPTIEVQHLPQVNLAELEADLEAADAAGDTATAEAIAAQIRSAQYTAGREAEVKARQTEHRAMGEKIATGAKEGVRRIPEGIQQLGLAIAEAAGFVDPGRTQAMTEEMMGRRFAATGGNADVEQSADVTEAVTSAIPGVSLLRTARVLPKIKETGKLVPAVARAMGGGATAGVVSGADETAEVPADVLATHAVNAGLGAGLTGLAALTMGAKPLVHNYMVRLKENADQNAAALAAQRNALDVGPLSLSQQSGNVVARNLEVQAYATKAQNFFNTQFERFAKATEAIVDPIRRAASSKNPDDLVTAWKVHKAWQAHKSATIAAANREYGGHISKAITLAGKDAAPFPLPFDNLAGVTSRWVSETGGQPWWRKIHPGADKLSPEFQSLDNYLTGIANNNARMNAPPGQFGTPRIGTAKEGISVQEMINARRALSTEDQSYWRAVREGRDPTPAQRDSHRAVREMMDAMDKDIDAFLAANKGRNLPAMEAIQVFRDANVKHKQFWEMQDFMGQTTAAQWFGGRISDDPAKSLLELARRSPAEQAILVNVLRNDPETLMDFRAGLVNQAMRAMLENPGRPAARGMIDPDRFVAQMTGEYGTIGKNIFTPGQLKDIEKAMNTVRVLANAPEGVMSVSRAPSVESTAMALISQSRAFLTRALVRISGLGKVEDLLFSDEGLKSLDTIHQVLRGTWRGSANEVTKAIAKIGAVAGTEEIPDEYVAPIDE